MPDAAIAKSLGIAVNTEIRYSGTFNDQKNIANPQKKIWIRTPLIPGATATDENIAKIGKFLKGGLLAGIKRWELCAFNNVCRDKYASMGQTWDYKDIPMMTDAQAGAYLTLAQKYVGCVAVLSGLTAK